jgi:hypothetical protein
MLCSELPGGLRAMLLNQMSIVNNLTSVENLAGIFNALPPAGRLVPQAI